MYKIKYSSKNISKYYNYLVSKAEKYYKNDNITSSINYIASAAMLQYNYNEIYMDVRLENLICNISKKILLPVMKSGLPNRYVFYDALGHDRQGLTQQYIRALNDLNSEYLFIFENDMDICKAGLSRTDLMNDLRKNTNVTIVELNSTYPLEEKIHRLYKIISDYNPSGLFLHLEPWSVVALVVFSSFPKLVKYQINLTDHTFWLGATLVNYSLEFRNYGYTVSLEKRFMSQEKLLLLPYYPIVEKEKFEGFPSIAKNKVIILSGGSYYKIYSKNEFFFLLLKDIVIENPNAVILFVGFGDDIPFKKFIAKNGLETRIVLLGFRKDINEVFQNSDIYLNTYPISGGLMSQYAAIHSKPLLVYSNGDRRVEDVVCTNKHALFTFFDRRELLDEVNILVKNEKYRKDRGNFFRSLVIDEKQFADEFKQLFVERKKSDRIAVKSKINYDLFCKNYHDRLNQYGYVIESILFRCLRWKIILMPKIIFNTLLSLREIIHTKYFK